MSPPTNNASVRLDGVARRYGAVQALDRLSLDLPVGKFVTLLGPSGCGKTTTLSLIAGLDQPDEGSIYLGDRDITHVPPNERGMAIVFQNYALYPHMSVFGNLAFSLKLQRRGKSEIQRRVFEVAEVLSIEHLLKRRPGQLSGGQQQRVAIGRALVKEPSVYLLDEPFSNLDAALRARMRTEIKRLHLSLGTTTIFVTHDQEEAMTLSDFVAVMNEGKLVQYGTQNEVYFRPKNTYVATFLGKPRMSLIEGALERHESGVDFVAPDLHVTLGTAAEIGLRDGTWKPRAGGRARRGLVHSAERHRALDDLQGAGPAARARWFGHVRGTACRRKYCRGACGAGSAPVRRRQRSSPGPSGPGPSVRRRHD